MANRGVFRVFLCISIIVNSSILGCSSPRPQISKDHIKYSKLHPQASAISQQIHTAIIVDGSVSLPSSAESIQSPSPPKRKDRIVLGPASWHGGGIAMDTMLTVESNITSEGQEQAYNDIDDFKMDKYDSAEKSVQSAAFIKGVIFDRLGLPKLGDFVVDVTSTIDKYVVEPINDLRSFRLGVYRFKILPHLDRDLDDLSLSLSVSF